MRFYGRENELHFIEEKILECNCKTKSIAIVGMGGLGKTQIAIEYIYRHVDEYTLIWWMNADTSIMLAEEYIKLGKAVGVYDDSLSNEQIIEVVKRYLEENDDWILIFDNANEVSDVEEYIPQNNNGNIIITSRNNNWSDIAKEVPLQLFNEEESKDFLLSRTEIKDDDKMNELVIELQGLPLALEQATSYIKAMKISFVRYLELFHKYKIQLFGRGDKPKSYGNTVATTWKISFENIRNRNSYSMDLLYIFSFMYCEDITLDMIIGGKIFLPDELAKSIENELDLNDIISELLRYSLITRENDKISIHRLVQGAIRNDMLKEEVSKWLYISVEIVEYIAKSKKNKKEIIEIYPHAYSVFLHLIEAKNVSDKNIDLACLICGCMYHKNQCNEGIEFVKKIKKATNDLKQLSEENKIKILLQLSAFYFYIEKPNENLKILETALKISRKLPLNKRIDEGEILNNIGGVYSNKDDYSTAITYYVQAIEFNKTLKKSTLVDFNNLRIFNNLIIDINKLGDFKKARKMMEDILNMKDMDKKIDRDTYALLLFNYSQMLREYGYANEALDAIKKTLSIDKKINGKYHPDVARDLNDYGIILMDLNRLEEAEEKLLDSVNINKKCYEENHPVLAKNYSNLGRIKYQQCNFKDAKYYHNKSLKINQSYYSEKSTNIANDYSNLGSVYLQLGDFEEALKLFKKALSIDRGIYKNINHPQIAFSLRNIALVHFESDNKKIEVAKKLCKKALSIDKSCGENNIRSIYYDNQLLINIYMEEGNIGTAKKIQKENISLSIEIFGDKHDSVFNNYYIYSKLLISSNDYGKAFGCLLRIKNKMPEKFLQGLCEMGIKNIEKNNNLKGVEQYLEKGIDLLEKNEIDANTKAIFLMLIGCMHFYRKKYLEALRYSQIALDKIKYLNFENKEKYIGVLISNMQICNMKLNNIYV